MSSQLGLRVPVLREERANRQKKTFTKWCNSHLEKVDHRRIKDLYVDLGDGLTLTKLLEVVSGETLGKRSHVRMQVHKLDNVIQDLKFLETKMVILTNVDAADIVERKPHIILGLIWKIFLRFHIQDITSEENEVQTEEMGKRELMLWIQKKVEGYRGVNIENCTSSWRNGLAFNAVIHAHRPDLIKFEDLDPQEHIHNLNNAFLIAENELGIARLLDAEDVDVPKPDDNSIMVYLASYYHYFVNLKTDDSKTKPGMQSEQPVIQSVEPVTLPEDTKRPRESLHDDFATFTNNSKDMTLWLESTIVEIDKDWTCCTISKTGPLANCHENLEQEMKTHKLQVDAICRFGEMLITSNHNMKKEIDIRVTSLRKMWSNLQGLIEQHWTKLIEARYQYYADCSKMELWIDEKMISVRSEDLGKDHQMAKNLLQKHYRLDEEIKNARPNIDDLNERATMITKTCSWLGAVSERESQQSVPKATYSAGNDRKTELKLKEEDATFLQRTASSGFQASLLSPQKNVEEYQICINKRYEEICFQSQQRRENLEYTICLFRFCEICKTFEAWIRDKEVNLKALGSLKQNKEMTKKKYVELLCDMTKNSGTITDINELAKQLIDAGHHTSDLIVKRQQHINDEWNRLNELKGKKEKSLTGVFGIKWFHKKADEIKDWVGQIRKEINDKALLHVLPDVKKEKKRIDNDEEDRLFTKQKNGIQKNVNYMKTKLRRKEIPHGVAEAELLLKQNQDMLNDIAANKLCIETVQELGGKISLRNMAKKYEIEETLKKLREEKDLLDDLWRMKNDYLIAAKNLQVFMYIKLQIDSFSVSRAQFLDFDNLETSVGILNDLSRKYSKFVKRLIREEDKLKLLDERTENLILEKNVNARIVDEKRKVLRYKLEASKKERLKPQKELEDYKELVNFKRHADDLSEWMIKKILVVSNESNQNTSNFWEMHQKDQELEAELKTSRNWLDQINDTGNKLIRERYTLHQKIRQIKVDLNETWAQLDDTYKDYKIKLTQAASNYNEEFKVVYRSLLANNIEKSQRDVLLTLSLKPKMAGFSCSLKADEYIGHVRLNLKEIDPHITFESRPLFPDELLPFVF